MNFLCRKPRQDASTGAFDLRHRPTGTTNTPPRRNDDASISMSSWANIDTERAAANHTRMANSRRASDSKINYDHRPSSRRTSSSKSHHPTRQAKPSKVKLSDDASISMSSWANISVGKISDSDNAHDRLFHSDTAIRYNGPTDIAIATKPAFNNTFASHKKSGADLDSKDPNSRHSRETSWGNFDVLGMLGDIENAREVAAKDILERRDLSERRKSGSRRMTAPPASITNGRGKPPVDSTSQRKSMRPPLAGGPNRRTASTRTRTQRV